MPASSTTSAEPPEPIARPLRGRASFTFEDLDPAAPALGEALRAWDWIVRSLLSGDAIGPGTRLRLEDERRITGELGRVLAGEEDGEGEPSERRITVARHAGQLQGIVSWVPCRRAVFAELIATAPWNLLAPGDPPDGRAVRGSGTALLAHLSRRAQRTGARGRVALQAENPRALAVYERLGYAPMRPSDAPLANVPQGKHGWSASVVRLASGRAGADEQRMPWLLFDPGARPTLTPALSRGERGSGQAVIRPSPGSGPRSSRRTASGPP
ncbi:MAG: GNAT family N-acetyltransferase [Anaeromyxobacteraceae bacterium]